MVERFHRGLKASLKACLDHPRWMDELPIVLLGIRTTWKDDIDAAPALLTYGTNLRIPGEYLPGPHDDTVSPTHSFVKELQEHMQNCPPPPPMHHGVPRSYVPKDLMSATHVYVRCDKHRGPLVRTYDGPFLVITKADKYFTISRNDKPIKVTVDRLKPAYSAHTPPPPAVVPDATQQVQPDAPVEHAPPPPDDYDVNYPELDQSERLVKTRSGRLVTRPARFKSIYHITCI